ncbi:MAG: TfoX/Sxy family protein [Verrucomicrobiota bacterium]
MANDRVFIEECTETLSVLGPVTAKRMFGGDGFFLEGMMFALAVDNLLYLKADDLNRPLFEERDLPPFTYQRGDRSASLSYHRVPEEALNHVPAMKPWAQSAWDAARRAAAKKQKKKKRAGRRK